MAHYEVEAKFEMSEEDFRRLVSQGKANSLPYKTTIDDYYEMTNRRGEFVRIRTWNDSVKVVLKSRVSQNVRRENEIECHMGWDGPKVVGEFVKDLGGEYSHSTIKTGKYIDFEWRGQHISLAAYSATTCGKTKYFFEVEMLPSHYNHNVELMEQNLQKILGQWNEFISEIFQFAPLRLVRQDRLLAQITYDMKGRE